MMHHNNGVIHITVLLEIKIKSNSIYKELTEEAFSYIHKIYFSLPSLWQWIHLNTSVENYKLTYKRHKYMTTVHTVFNPWKGEYNFKVLCLFGCILFVYLHWANGKWWTWNYGNKSHEIHTSRNKECKMSTPFWLKAECQWKYNSYFCFNLWEAARWDWNGINKHEQWTFSHHIPASSYSSQPLSSSNHVNILSTTEVPTKCELCTVICFFLICFLVTWKVVTMRKIGSLEAIKMELEKYHIGIAAVQEIR